MSYLSHNLPSHLIISVSQSTISYTWGRCWMREERDEERWENNSIISQWHGRSWDGKLVYHVIISSILSINHVICLINLPYNLSHNLPCHHLPNLVERRLKWLMYSQLQCLSQSTPCHIVIWWWSDEMVNWSKISSLILLLILRFHFWQFHFDDHKSHLLFPSYTTISSSPPIFSKVRWLMMRWLMVGGLWDILLLFHHLPSHLIISPSHHLTPTS